MMGKIKVANGIIGYPMPMVIVGAEVEVKANFMAVAWVSRVNFNPPLIAVALGKSHYTNKGIHQNSEFSISVPSEDMLTTVDYVGLVSGEKTDKSSIFNIFRGELSHAPMVMDCPFSMECRLVDVVDLPTNELFIGEIIGVYCDEKFLDEGKPHRVNMHPYMLTMPENSYWSLGSHIGHAWDDGKKYMNPH
jgi:flavin reductase (DIM6/NTAB) family NADH-FMN oxidoreductase RutF